MKSIIPGLFFLASIQLGHDCLAITTQQELNGETEKLALFEVVEEEEGGRGGLRATSRTEYIPVPRVVEEGDLSIRFNKFTFFGGEENQPDFLPLQAVDYPIRDDIALALKNESNAVSVLCDGDPSLDLNHRVKIRAYLNAIGGTPSMPNSDREHEFWNEFRVVVEQQIGRRQNVNPDTIMRKPDLWAFRDDIHTVAEAVRAEYPGSLQAELIQWLWAQGVKLDNEIIPFRSRSDFVALQVGVAELNTWAVGTVAPMNFYMKWFVGRPRPEEIAYKIATGELSYDDGVPHDIVQMVRSMNLTSPAEFTAYPEGCPRHPSWPAMHSAASSASFWLAVVLNLTEEQYCEALRVDYAVAFARTCAGVHYESDNTAGLNLGQAIMEEKLPAYLAERFGSDPEKVRAKMYKMRFDWSNFNSFTCTM